MRKQVSTSFAIIVIVFALAVGGLYFAWQYRAYEAAERAQGRMLQRQAEMARQSGRAGMGGGSMMKRMRGGGGTGAKSGPTPGGPTAPGKAAAQPGKAPVKPEKAAPAKPTTSAPASTKAAPTKTEKK